MNEWAMKLSKYIPARPEVCRWLLNELGTGHPKATTLKELLLSADDSVRAAAGVVLQAALRQSAAVVRGTSSGARGGDCPLAADDGPYVAAYAGVMREQDGREGVEERAERAAVAVEGQGGKSVVETRGGDDQAGVVKTTVRFVCAWRWWVELNLAPR